MNDVPITAEAAIEEKSFSECVVRVFPADTFTIFERARNYIT